jgi:magnesium chelatase family protein
MLVAAMNPCPCGYHGDTLKECVCSSAAITRYQKRISGPLMDRIDIQAEVPRVAYEKLSASRLGEPSSKVRERVENARERQRIRLNSSSRSTNGDMVPQEIREFCPLDSEGKSLLRTASQQLSLSARAYHRVLKLSRTIADLADAGDISPLHLAEALQYQPRER